MKSLLSSNLKDELLWQIIIIIISRARGSTSNSFPAVVCPGSKPLSSTNAAAVAVHPHTHLTPSAPGVELPHGKFKVRRGRAPSLAAFWCLPYLPTPSYTTVLCQVSCAVQGLAAGSSAVATEQSQIVSFWSNGETKEDTESDLNFLVWCPLNALPL